MVMIYCDNEEGKAVLSGDVEDIKIEMLKIMESFTTFTQSTPDEIFGMKGVKEMFEEEPKIVTDFTRMFVKATQQ
jgi:hypothetical protein